MRHTIFTSQSEVTHTLAHTRATKKTSLIDDDVDNVLVSMLIAGGSWEAALVVVSRNEMSMLCRHANSSSFVCVCGPDDLAIGGKRVNMHAGANTWQQRSPQSIIKPKKEGGGKVNLGQSTIAAT